MAFQVFLSVLCVLIVYFLYCYKKIHYRFESGGLKYLRGVPIFGNSWQSIFMRRHFMYDLEEVYSAFPNEKYVGFADGMMPVILVRDPAIMKIITTKDFGHFQNRKQFVPLHLDPLLGKNILELKDAEWKIARTQLSPAFTSLRLRHMLPVLINVSKHVVKSLSKFSCKEVDLSESMIRYAGDSLAAAAFGFDQANAGREGSMFSKVGATLNVTVWTRILTFIYVQFPNLGEVIQSISGLQLFPKYAHDFFRKVMFEALEYRKKNNISIPDYTDVLKNISDDMPLDYLAGQFFSSYGASIDSGSGLLRLCLHELTLNPGLQERLYQEVRAHEELGELTIGSINELHYLDCVLKETMRKWSAAVMMDRVCSKRYVLPPPREGGERYTVQRGDLIYNVVHPVHMDPKYYPNPEVFNPERFSHENKKQIQSFTFLPFGTGPRGCLGGRFSVLQMKVLIYHMALTFKLVKCGKTADPIELEAHEIIISPRGGTWVCLELRE